MNYNRSVPFDRGLIEAQLSLDLIGSSDMPKIALDAMEAGLDGPAIRRLAVLDSPSYFEVRDVLRLAMEEMRLTKLPAGVAALRIAKDLAKGILSRGDDPLKHTRVFNMLWIRAGYAREVESVGLLSDDIYIADTVGHESEETIREWITDRLKALIQSGDDAR